VGRSGAAIDSRTLDRLPPRAKQVESIDVSALEPASEKHGHWRIRRTTGSAEGFHNRRPNDDTDPEIWIHTVDRPTLVLGSAQSDSILQTLTSGVHDVAVCRRRSGGGVVYIDPINDCWIDVVLPAGSKLHHPDIARSFRWVGQVWAATLQTSLIHPVTNTASPSAPTVPVAIAESSGRSVASRLVCFAGTGHGEVSVDGNKVVGLSQRRTKTWSRVQTIATRNWQHESLSQLLNPEALSAADIGDLALVPAGLPAPYTLPPNDDLIATFLRALPLP